MSKNRQGGFSGKTINKEWGSKHRKQEDGLRNLKKRAAIESIAEQKRDIYLGCSCEQCVSSLKHLFKETLHGDF